MFKHPTALLVSIALTLSFGCGHNHGTDGSPSHDARHDHESHESAGPATMHLNQGQKWLMDDHTRTVTANMATAVMDVDFAALDDSELQSLGADLKADINTLIQGCTMTGDAHDQLHLFLASYIPAVESLANVGSMEDAENVRRLLASYDEFFE